MTYLLRTCDVFSVQLPNRYLIPIYLISLLWYSNWRKVKFWSAERSVLFCESPSYSVGQWRSASHNIWTRKLVRLEFWNTVEMIRALDWKRYWALVFMEMWKNLIYFQHKCQPCVCTGNGKTSVSLSKDEVAEWMDMWMDLWVSRKMDGLMDR